MISSCILRVTWSRVEKSRETPFGPWSLSDPPREASEIQKNHHIRCKNLRVDKHLLGRPRKLGSFVSKMGFKLHNENLPNPISYQSLVAKMVVTTLLI